MTNTQEKDLSMSNDNQGITPKHLRDNGNPTPQKRQ